MRHTALCIASGISCTRTILRDLRRCGFTAGEIAVVAAPNSPDKSSAAVTPAPQDPAFTQRWSALVGAASGEIAGLEVDSLPGIGTAIGRGPLLAALADPVIAGIGSGIGAALCTVGFHGDQSQWIAEQLRPGTMLISVTTANGYEIETILQIYREAGATSLSQSTDPREAALPVLQQPGETWAVIPQAAVHAERVKCPA
jgi:hypothetical protein